MNQFTKKIVWDKIDTLHGEVILLATEKGICWTGTPGTSIEKAEKWMQKHFVGCKLQRNAENVVLKKAIKELEKYFSGEKVQFSALLDLDGTEFQKKVWKEMYKIPYGKTITYGQLATKVGSPKAARAIGMCCNKNPIAIINPCHRVIGSTGKLTGYAGGLSTKEWLLSIEQKLQSS